MLHAVLSGDTISFRGSGLSRKGKSMKRRIVREVHRGEAYEYFPLGKFVVSAPAVCRGRPTFKHTRIEVAGVLARLGAGHAIDDLVDAYQGRVPRAAIEEATSLAAKALVQQFPARSSK